MENSDKWHFSEVHIGTSAVIIGDPDRSTECIFRSLWITLSCVVNPASLREGMDRLKQLGHAKLIQLNKAKCMELHLCRGNQYRVGDEWMESSTD